MKSKIITVLAVAALMGSCKKPEVKPDWRILDLYQVSSKTGSYPALIQDGASLMNSGNTILRDSIIGVDTLNYYHYQKSCYIGDDIGYDGSANNLSVRILITDKTRQNVITQINKTCACTLNLKIKIK